MSLLPGILTRVPRSWLSAIAAARHRHSTVNRCADLVASLIRDRDSRIYTGVGRGLRFNPGRSAVSYVLGTVEPETQCALAKILRPGMTFYDIGANVGFYSLIAARLVNPGGRVVSVEPLPENASALKHNVDLNQFSHLSIFEIALGISDGDMSFAKSNRMTDGRLESVGLLPSEYSGNTRVTVRRLDSMVAEANLPPPDLIKIDVEGAEDDVLRGAYDTLARHRPVLIIELHGTNEAVVRTLARAGYCAASLYPYSSITEAHWNACIVAVVSEKPEMMQSLVGDRLAWPSSNAASSA